MKKRFPISLVDIGSKFLHVGKIGKHLYVDPTTYQAMDDAVEDFANEVNRESFHIVQCWVVVNWPKCIGVL